MSASIAKLVALVSCLAGLLGAAPAHAQDGAGAEPTDAELEAELAQMTNGREAIGADEPSLRFYGFADALLMKAFPRHQYGAFPPKGVSFYVGNINLYAAADLTHGFSSLIEVRFSYLPNGALDPNSLAFVSTSVFDYADWNRPTRWGGIVLERVHLDYRFKPWLGVRAGQWLTPYGIWNVDHGSPTVIPVGKPYVVGEQLIPTRQTGFQLFGDLLIGDVTLAYNLTLSNGRGDFEQIDLDTNKAVGGHLSASTSNIGLFTFGLSAYGGLSSKSPKVSVTAGNPPDVNVDSLDRYKEFAVGADLLWEWRGLRVQGEALFSQINYKDPARKLATALGTTSGFVPDRLAWGSYLLLAYRLPWFGLSPYMVVDYFDRGYARGQLLVFGGNTVNVMAVTGGINFRPIPAVVLKLQYSHITFPGSEDDSKLPNLSFQIAWAF